MLFSRRRQRKVTQGTFLCCVMIMVVFVILSQKCFQNGVCFEKTKGVEEGALKLLRRQSTVWHGKSDAGCVKTILLYGMKPHWKQFCNQSDMSRYRSLIQLPKKFACAGLNCKVELRYSEVAADVRNADIVAFTNTIRWMTKDMWDWVHGNRSERQRWVFISRESPIYSAGVRPPEEYINTTYHWIASYKSDSEIYLPFGFYEPFPKQDENKSHYEETLINKTKAVAWLSSKCKSLHWDMAGFVKDLDSLITVDELGDCSKRKIPWRNDAEVRKLLLPYKFSLCLEDSCCDDFITERFWKSLELGLVPVVVGASFSQYARVAPPSSFIHVDQFDSMEELAVYLTYLTEHEDQYLQFHDWRKLGSVVSYDIDDKYVEPLRSDTHCSILKTYLSMKGSDERTIDYFGERWGRSCSFCGYKWIQSYGHKARH